MRILISVAALLLLTACGGKSEKDLLGSWEGQSDDNKVVLTFSKDNKFKMDVGMPVEMTGTYKVDMSKKPHHIDITFTVKMGDKSETNTVYGVFEFVDENTIKMNDLAEKRSTEFGENTDTFKRKKK